MLRLALLTEAVHLSHLEYHMLKVLRNGSLPIPHPAPKSPKRACLQVVTKDGGWKGAPSTKFRNPQEVEVGKGKKEYNKNMENKKILIVDDDKFLLDMYCLKFKKSNFEVSGAPSGHEALKTLEGGFTPDIVMMDLVMPGMDGFELLQNIREKNMAPKAVIVVLTNQGQPSDIEKAKEMKVDGYIVKASSIPSEVVEKVKHVYEEKMKFVNS